MTRTLIHVIFTIHPVRWLLVLLTLMTMGLITRVSGQGCSDAGFCTMGAMKPDQDFNRKLPLRLRALELNFYRGTATLSPVIYVATVDFSFSFREKTSFQVKLPYQMVTGNFGSTSGLGDISLSLTRTLHQTENLELNATVGAKIPTNRSDLENFDAGFGRALSSAKRKMLREEGKGPYHWAPFILIGK